MKKKLKLKRRVTVTTWTLRADRLLRLEKRVERIEDLIARLDADMHRYRNY